MHNLYRRGAQGIVELFNAIDAWRKPQRVLPFAQCCKCDFIGRKGFENRPFPRLGYFMKMFEICSEVKASEFVKKFEEAMDDDNNTANAIAAVFDLVKYSNSNVSSDNTKQFAEAMYEILTELTDVLGIILEKEEEAQGDEDYINEMIEKRAQAKKDKDFALADQIRDELLEKGIVLEDTREGTKWSRK